MRILLTGASGLLGRHAFARLQAAGHEVIPLARSRSLHPGTILADLSDDAHLDRLPRQIDGVIHLAALLPAPGVTPPPGRWMQDNTRASLNALEHCARSGARVFVLGSSWSVYGTRRHRGEVDETAPPGPDDLYGLSKHAAELLCEPYAFYYGIKASVLRYSYLYGPGMRRDTVVCSFLRAAMAGAELALYDDGIDLIDLLHVEDAASATLAALAGPAGVYNIGGGPVSIRALAEASVSAVGSASALVSRKAGGGQRRLRLSSEKARSALGWSPRITLLEGLGDLARSGQCA